MSDPEDFTAYTRIADELIDKATKDELADVARLLALNIGWYHEKVGDVPQDILLRLVRAETLGDEAQRLLLHGMQNLVSALGEVMGVGDGGGDAARH